MGFKRQRLVLEGSVRDARIIDNTLPLAAYDYYRQFKDPGYEPLDPHARQSFIQFVDGYVNTPAAVILPHGRFDEADPFTALWHSEPAEVSVLQHSERDVPESSFVQPFLKSVARRPEHWLGLIRLRWELEVIQDFKRRAPNWREEFAETLDILLPHLHNAGRRNDQALTKLADGLAALDAAAAVDAEYAAEAERRGIELYVYALADALSWFRRGASYRWHARDRALRVHPLRLSAVDGSDPGISIQGDAEVSWSLVLERALREGSLPATDPQLFTNLLYHLKQITLHDPEFIEGLVEYRARRKSEGYLRDHLVRAASKAGMALNLRDSTFRKLVINAMTESLEHVPMGVGKVIKPFACLIFESLDSQPLHILEAKGRLKAERTFGAKADLWRTFKISVP